MRLRCGWQQGGHRSQLCPLLQPHVFIHHPHQSANCCSRISLVECVHVYLFRGAVYAKRDMTELYMSKCSGRDNGQRTRLLMTTSIQKERLVPTVGKMSKPQHWERQQSQSHPPWHSAGPCVSSAVYQPAVLPFYCCHYQGNLGKQWRTRLYWG